MSEYNKQLQMIRQSRIYPIYECLINPNWKEMGHARIIISRKMPNNNLILGVYMVDLFCLGLKDTFCSVDIHQLKYESELKGQIYFDSHAKKCDLSLAYEIIYGSIDYARKLGFSPQKDFKLSQYLLDPKQDIEMKHNIQFGCEGKPLYIRGPNDDADHIIRILERNVGDGNFGVMCGECGNILENIDEIINAGYLTPEKIGRNEPCLCGSGKKYKKCCGK